MNAPKSSRTKFRFVLVAVGAIACAAVFVDKVRFERACRTINVVSSELGGHPYSIGGWPFGQEYVIRFDHALTDDALQHLAAAAPESRRISLRLYFTCEIPDVRLSTMREMMETHRINISVSPVGE